MARSRTRVVTLRKIRTVRERSTIRRCNHRMRSRLGLLLGTAQLLVADTLGIPDSSSMAASVSDAGDWLHRVHSVRTDVDDRLRAPASAARAGRDERGPLCRGPGLALRS